MPAFWKIMEEIKSNNEKRVVMPAFWKIMKEIKSNNEERVVMPAFWKIMKEIKSNTKVSELGMDLFNKPAGCE